MQTEIEAKFLNIDRNDLISRLSKLGAVCVAPRRIMTRANYDYPDSRLDRVHNGWVRVRDEGDKVTLSYKQLNDRTVTGTKEVNMVVDSFTAAHDFLLAIGLVKKSHQETRRESWELNGVQIEIDEWPWVPTFCEVEAPSEAHLIDTANAIGFNMDAAKYGSVEVVYQSEYDVTEDEINHLEEIKFSDVPAWLQERKR